MVDPNSKTLGGFDITEINGLIKIKTNEEINVEKTTENHTTTDTWEIIVTFMNLETDQNLNTGKKLTGKVIIQKENLTQALDKVLADANKEDGTQTVHYHDKNLIGGAQDNSYRYSGTNYEITSEQVDQIISGLYEEKTYGTLSTKYYLKTASNKDLIDKMFNISCYIRNECKYQADYDIDNDGSVDMADVYALMKQNDTSGYYEAKEAAADAAASKGLASEYGVKSLVNNYVCLDGTTTTGKCANGDNDLYRIIGFFLNDDGLYEMKLVKSDYATKEQLGEEGTYNVDGITTTGSVTNKYYYLGNLENYDSIGGYYWTKDGVNNEWNGSILRTVNLNEKYLSYLKEKGVDVDNLITNHVWKTIGYSSTSVAPKTFYDYEMGNIVEENATNPAETKEVSNKIGLIYVSDYGYASDPNITNNWTTNMPSYSGVRIKSNWLYMGLSEWTITRNSRNENNAHYITDEGNENSSNIVNYSLGIRPSFYISAKTQITSGNGTKEEPYRLSIAK